MERYDYMMLQHIDWGLLMSGWGGLMLHLELLLRA